MKTQTSTTENRIESGGQQGNGPSNDYLFAKATFGYSRLFLLGLMAMALCLAMPLALFAPVPLALAFLLFGRLKTWIMATLIVAPIVMFLSLSSNEAWKWIGVESVLMFIFSQLSAALVSEIIFRKVKLDRGLITASLLFIFTLSLLVIGLDYFGKFEIVQKSKDAVTLFVNKIKLENKEILETPGEDTRELLVMLERPELIWRWLPALYAGGIIVQLWITLFMLLRNSRVWQKVTDYSFELKDLYNFRVPDLFVWPLIVALLSYVLSDYLKPTLGQNVENFSGNVLVILATFYFFQGFGVFLEFLNFLKIGGIFRTLFIFGIILMAGRYLAVVGVFDMWINFKRFLKINNDN